MPDSARSTISVTEAPARKGYVADVGIHEIGVDAYHADPCPSPSLSSSGIRYLRDQRPAHLAANHPWLTRWPNHVKKSTKEQDLGSVIHRLVLGAGSDFEVGNFADWRTDASKEFRDEARKLGKIPILRPMYEQASKVEAEFRSRLTDHFGDWPVGTSEVTMVRTFETEHGTIYGRALADHLMPELALCLDLKTTGRPLSDSDIDKRLIDSDVQAGWYLEFLAALFELDGREKFLFAFAEVEPPYDIRFVEFPESWRARTRFVIERSCNTFARCLATGEWLGYARETYHPTIPPWHEKRLVELELAEGIGE